jgi:hypothetical protein
MLNMRHGFEVENKKMISLNIKQCSGLLAQIN